MDLGLTALVAPVMTPFGIPLVTTLLAPITVLLPMVMPVPPHFLLLHMLSPTVIGCAVPSLDYANQHLSGVSNLHTRSYTKIAFVFSTKLTWAFVAHLVGCFGNRHIFLQNQLLCFH